MRGHVEKMVDKVVNFDNLAADLPQKQISTTRPQSGKVRQEAFQSLKVMRVTQKKNCEHLVNKQECDLRQTMNEIAANFPSVSVAMHNSKKTEADRAKER